MKITVSIADDHAIVTNGIAHMLKNHPLVTVLDTAGSGEALLQALHKRQPDVLLLDIQLPDRPGDELAKYISETWPLIAIITLTNMDQTFYVRNMFLNGAKGYLLKSATTDVLIEAIETVMRGKQYIDVPLREQMALEMLDIHNQGKPMLTKRERQILELIVDEKTNTEIAKILLLSISTVENHRINLFFKMGVKNSAGLVRKAIQLGMIKAG